jgi:hypothetical protein
MSNANNTRQMKGRGVLIMEAPDNQSYQSFSVFERHDHWNLTKRDRS